MWFIFTILLREVGLPDDAALWALLLFNLGLEVGQLMVVAVCLLLGALLRYWQLNVYTTAGVRLTHLLPAYLIGPVSVRWLLQRLPLPNL